MIPHNKPCKIVLLAALALFGSIVHSHRIASGFDAKKQTQQLATQVNDNGSEERVVAVNHNGSQVKDWSSAVPCKGGACISYSMYIWGCTCSAGSAAWKFELDDEEDDNGPNN